MMADSAGSLDVDLEAQQPSATPPPYDDEEREIRVFMSLLLESEPTERIQSDSRVPSPAEVDVETQTEQLNQPQEPQPEPVGDFDENSNALWTLYEKEARAHDEALIKTWKEDMDGILIFAGLFSAALTSFIAESNETLQVDPMQEMVYYQRQSVAMLAQLSQQVASITPQVSIPTTPLPPFPTFRPSPSDVRVNVYYFMSLVFSLSAALLATLVQQWIRDYMHVFQRYGHPLKSARIRQFLYDGTEKWYMPVVAEAVPGFVHVSLFLFFLGLADSTFHLNTTVGIATVTPICICGLLYVSCMFAPILDPQSPYQNPFSGLLWYLIQKVHGRVYMDRASGGTLAHVSSNMPVGQMQLAMEETEGRKNRDVRAICWLIDHLTEDTEIESLVLAIPGSFHSQWGRDAWKEVALVGDGGAASVDLMPLPPVQQPSLSARPSLASRGTLRDLCGGIGRMLQTCDSRNHNLFANEDARQSRLKACLETAAWLVCCGNAELGWFGHDTIFDALDNIRVVDELPEGSYDEAFVLRRSCLVLLVARKKLRSGGIWKLAGEAIAALATQYDPGPDVNFIEAALKNARYADEDLDEARCQMRELYEALPGPYLDDSDSMLSMQQVKGHLNNHRAQACWLSEQGVLPFYQDVDERFLVVQRELLSVLRRPLHCVPGIVARDPRTREGTRRPNLSFPEQLLHKLPRQGVAVPQLTSPGHMISALSSFGPDVLYIIDGRESPGAREVCYMSSSTPKHVGLDTLEFATWQTHTTERQLWRLEDLFSGHGLGFSVELFFLMALPHRDQLTRLYPSDSDTNRDLYFGLFRAMTSGWEQSRHSLGTQHLLLDLICDLNCCGRDGRELEYGFYGRITHWYRLYEELLALVGNLLDGQAGSHIDDALRRLETESAFTPSFQHAAVRVIRRATRRSAPSPRNPDIRPPSDTSFAP